MRRRDRRSRKSVETSRLLLALAAFWHAPAFAQISPADTAPAASVEQIVAPSPASALSSPQLTLSDAARLASPQFIDGTGQTRAEQLNKDDPSARPPEPLSDPSQGRTGEVSTVTGRDRCDPAEPERDRLQRCAAVIETRAGEFARPDPMLLSPEQRLLVEQQRYEPGGREAGRRLAQSGQDAESPDAQALASMIFRPDAPAPPPKPETAIPDATTAVLNAIVNGNGVPRP